jgi:predicted alpha/beta superfamily hydrolase
MKTQVKKLNLKNKIFNRVKEKDFIRGSIHRIENFSSNFLNNKRHIDIYLPPSYNFNKSKYYPVIYMHDGNNLFYPSISFAGVPWRVDKTLDMLINNRLIEEVIIVGIFNTIQRDYEYTWTKINFGNKIQGGGGSLYAKFIIEELKQFIDSNFRTLKDRNNTSIIGSSLGGLISFYIGLYYPNIFSKIGIMSPSFWWNYGIAFKDVSNISNNLKIWLDIGTKEGYARSISRNMNIMTTRFMRELLINKGYIEGYNLAYFEDKGAKHNEYFWGKRFHLPMIFLFSKNYKIIFK